MTCDTQQVGRGQPSLKVSAEDLEEKGRSVNQSISY